VTTKKLGLFLMENFTFYSKNGEIQGNTLNENIERAMVSMKTAHLT
jgi:hypothetical protein